VVFPLQRIVFNRSFKHEIPDRIGFGRFGRRSDPPAVPGGPDGPTDTLGMTGRGLYGNGIYGDVQGRGIYGGIQGRGIYGGIVPDYLRNLPSYGPYVRYGNTYGISPFGGLMDQQYRFPGQFNTMGGPIDPRIMFPYGSIVPPQYNPYIQDTMQGRMCGIYGCTPDQQQQQIFPDQMMGGINQYTDTDMISPFSSQLTTGGVLDVNSLTGVTPFSQAALFNLLTRGGIGKLDLYSKLILGHGTGLSRKMREVCPEVDGGLSYVSCLTDAHSKTFRCLKSVQEHPRFLQCSHKPIIKKVMRDWYVHDYNWHKELVSCLATTTYADKLKEKLGNVVPPVPLDNDMDDITDELIPTTGIQQQLPYNVEFGVNTRQCFYKLRSTVTRCNELASQCPKFRKCYVHPTIKTLEARKHVKQAKFVKLLDSCLNGAFIPEDVVVGPTADIDPIDSSIFSDIIV